MQNKQLIAVFSDDLKLEAFVEVDQAVSIEIPADVDADRRVVMQGLVESFRTRMPRLKSQISENEYATTYLVEVGPEDKNYSIAVCEEFRMAGFSARIVPFFAKSILTLISNELNMEQREKVMAEVVNLPNDTEEEVVLSIQKMLEDHMILKRNREEFRNLIKS